MRLVFMGTPEFALPSLRILIEHRYDIPMVVTVPDKPAGRGLHTTASPVKDLARANNIPVLTPSSLRDEQFIGELRNLKADCFVVVAFRILPPEVYSIPKLGAFNLHASLLPRYRGAAPINWALINGESETGVTTFFLQKSVDTGNVIIQESIGIGPDETAGELHDRLAALGADVVLKTVRMIGKGTTSPVAQDQSQATLAPKIFSDDCRIDWHSSAARVHNIVRGLSPRPGAFTTHSSRQLKVYRTRIVDAPRKGEPGEVLASGTRLIVATGSEGAVEILELQAEGKKRMEAGAFLRGYTLREGEKLAS